MNKKEAVMSALRFLEPDTVVHIWNDFCEVGHSLQDYVYFNAECELDNLFQCASDALRASSKGFYSYNDLYFAFPEDGDGAITSFSDLESPRSPISFELLAEWLIEKCGYTRGHKFDVYLDLFDSFYVYLTEVIPEYISIDDFEEKAQTIMEDEYVTNLFEEDWKQVADLIAEKIR